MDSIIPEEETIAAVSSSIASGKGGIAIIRISGADAISICQNIIETKSKYAWKTHRVFHGYVKDNELNKIIDESLIIVMKSPNSFTGEDIVEINCHGGIIIVNQILNLILKSSNARLANPGEFSQRAFLNGKIDLTQAESINQLICANNIRAAEMALQGVTGEIKKQIYTIKNSLINQLSEIEARVDFEEDFGEFDYINFSENITLIKNNINNLIENSRRNTYLHNGISIALIGQTNVGKSSLLNLLSKQNKAIVTDIPGTTRDIIEVNLLIRDLPIKIIDTAGIRDTKDLIEIIGINKTLEIIKKTDFVLYIYDLSKGLDEEDKKIISKIPSNKLISIIGNKKDLIEDEELIKKNYSEEIVLMSIKNKIGEKILLEKIFKKCEKNESTNLEIFLNDRQISNLQDCLKNLNDTNHIIDNKLPFDLLSIELRDGIKNLAKLTGEELTEELLNNIFSKFCIGK